jgi:REP element-mobilizing transposase RayT
MPVKQQITEPDGVYFITFTCHQWLPLIAQTNSYDLIYNWFDYLKSKGHYINGFVIMPNHVHALISFRNTGQSINIIVGNGKRFIAYKIIERLKEQNENKLLHHLQESVETKEREKNKKHEVWEDSFDWKECRTHHFMQQKLDYMHDNPCKGKWNLAPAPVDYVHSSAKFYITGEQSVYRVTSYLELDDIDLTKPLSIHAESTPHTRPSSETSAGKQ